MFDMAYIIFMVVLCAAIAVMAWRWLDRYCEFKEIVEEKDDFEKLMRKQLELDSARLKAQEDLLRKACCSWAESDGEEAE